MSFGQTKELAIKRFYAQERKLEKNHELKTIYKDFMREYQALGHMSKINFNLNDKIEFFLLHHHVLGKIAEDIH